MTERPPTLRKSNAVHTRDLTPLFASMTALLFAVELYASATSRHWDWSFWAHIVIVGTLGLFLVGYIVVRVRGVFVTRSSTAPQGVHDAACGPATRPWKRRSWGYSTLGVSVIVFVRARPLARLPAPRVTSGWA